MVSAAQSSNLIIRYCFLAVGKLSQCQDVLKAFVKSGDKSAKIVSAPRLPEDAKDVGGVEVMFVMPSMVEEERLEEFRYWLGTWLRNRLAEGSVTPSPEPTVVGKGLEFINKALDRMAQGVSCTKLVVEIDE
ncbi:hypothetical protein FPOA_08995 [Fusarium poae]|uniref:Alcohol dehydrogenase-like C-terminal domain-containing protein n=1 Tax=Fusarium poae TaxID=36050 RepID=A0A1B8AQ45_FUSPO|nr:hypothetical protein FPOA_08995 [Fusarium poae]